MRRSANLDLERWEIKRKRKRPLAFLPEAQFSQMLQSENYTSENRCQ